MRTYVYVAAPFEDVHVVRDLHERMHALGLVPTARWVEGVNGVENQARFTAAELRAFAERNDHDLARSHALIVLARAGGGGEMFAEMTRALILGLRVYYVGRRRILSAWRKGVVLCEDVDDALAQLLAVRATRVS